MDEDSLRLSLEAYQSQVCLSSSSLLSLLRYNDDGCHSYISIIIIRLYAHYHQFLIAWYLTRLHLIPYQLAQVDQVLEASGGDNADLLELRSNLLEVIGLTTGWYSLFLL